MNPSVNWGSLLSGRAKYTGGYTVECRSFDEMTDLPADLRAHLREKYYISVAIIEKRQISDYDNTRKYLLCLPDGAYVECV